MNFNKRTIIILTIDFFMVLFFTFPTLTYSPFIYYEPLKKHFTWLNPEKYKIIYRNSVMFNIPVEKICSIIKYESGGKSTAISIASARGLMQIMHFHHRGNPTDLYNDELNIYYGTKYYRICLDMAKGNEKEALRFYNAGPASNPKKYKNWKTYVEPILVTEIQAEKDKYNNFKLQ